jgi:hypothetical protein
MRFAGVISTEFGQAVSLFTGWQTPLPEAKIGPSQVHLNQKRPLFRFTFLSRTAVRRLVVEGKSVSDIARTFNVHVATIYRLAQVQ